MQGFLATRNIEIKEVVNAAKEKLRGETALALARQASRILVAKGKKVVTANSHATTPNETATVRPKRQR